MQSSASYIDGVSSLISFFTLKELINQIGTTTPGVPRLGVPKYSPNGSDCANFATARNEYEWATSFPMPMASMNRTLIDQIGTLISRQARAFNNARRYGLDSYAPNINAFHSLLRGRGQETPGEDLSAVSQYAYGYITGTLGGFEPEYIKIVATAKHFGGYDLENYENQSRLRLTSPTHPGYAYTDLIPFIDDTLTVMNTSCVASDYSAIFFANTTMQPASRRVRATPVNIGSMAGYTENGDAVLYLSTYQLALDNEGDTAAQVTLTGSEAVLLHWMEWEQQVGPTQGTL